MRRATTFMILVLIGLSTHSSSVQPVYAQESVLENYILSHGGTPPSRPDGVVVKLSDGRFGGGTSEARIKLKTRSEFTTLSLSVFREVGPGDLALAMLVSRVEVRGYDWTGELIYERDLAGFSFRDSASGQWAEELSDIPPTVRQVKITFLGNYE